MSTLVRLEYLTPDGWVVAHAGIALLDPQRYVDRLTARKKFGRCTVLDGSLQATGKVYQPDNLPDPKTLVPSDTQIPKLPEPEKTCPLCDSEHPKPWDGSCLL
jgi:hypothetical protein